MKTFVIATLVLLFAPSIIAQNWKEIDKHLPDPFISLMPQAFYGQVIDIDDNYAIVGANGYATILFYNGSNWVQEAELTPSDFSEDFGISVSISNDVIVIGSAGKAYVYQKPITGWVDQTESAILTATNSTDPTLGSAVSIFDDHIIVGNPGYNNNTGCVYIYKKPTNGWVNMTQTAILTATGGSPDDYFGFSVDLADDAAVVGMPSNYFVGQQKTGKAMVFVKPSTGWVNNAGNIILDASDASLRNQLGFSVGISGDYIVLGAPYASFYGQAYVYKKNIGGWSSSNETAILRQRIRTPDTIPTNTILFGQTVAISGDNIVVGGYDRPNDYNFAGFAYVFTQPNTGWIDTTETAQLTKTGSKQGNNFGIGVGVSNTHIMVGDSEYGYNELGIDYLGAIYAYEAPTNGWVDTVESTIKVNPTRAHTSKNRFGQVVDINGDYAVIGAPGFNNNTGRASVYYYDGNQWIFLAHLLASNSNTTMGFGTSVSILGDYIFIGAPNDLQKGAVFVYKKPITGWVDATETAKLVASDGANNDFFGNSIDISSNHLVVGAYKDDDWGAESGSAYVFTKPITGWVNGTETAKLLPSNGNSNHTFGISVAIDGDYIVIGASYLFGFGTATGPGTAYLFEKPTTGWTNMSETARLNPSDGILNGRFGSSIDIFGDDVLVGAIRDNQNGNHTGSAYLFSKPTTGWNNATENAKLTASDGASIYQFGFSLAIDEHQAIIGTPYTNDLGANSGSIYIFNKPNTGWITTVEDTKLIPSDGWEEDNFGINLALSGEHMLVGAWKRNESDISAGAAYFFYACPETITTIDTTIQQGSSIVIGNNTYSSAGVYMDTFTVQNCDSIVITNLTIDVSITQILNKQNNKLKLFPNPSRGLIHLELAEQENIQEIEIFDRLGKLVYYKKTPNHQIDLTTFPSGLYLLRVNQKYSQSFILSDE